MFVDDYSRISHPIGLWKIHLLVGFEFTHKICIGDSAEPFARKSDS